MIGDGLCTTAEPPASFVLVDSDGNHQQRLPGCEGMTNGTCPACGVKHFTNPSGSAPAK